MKVHPCGVFWGLVFDNWYSVVSNASAIDDAVPNIWKSVQCRQQSERMANLDLCNGYYYHTGEVYGSSALVETLYRLCRSGQQHMSCRHALQLQVLSHSYPVAMVRCTWELCLGRIHEELHQPPPSHQPPPHVSRYTVIQSCTLPMNMSFIQPWGMANTNGRTQNLQKKCMYKITRIIYTQPTNAQPLGNSHRYTAATNRYAATKLVVCLVSCSAHVQCECGVILLQREYNVCGQRWQATSGEGESRGQCSLPCTQTWHRDGR